MISHLPPSIEGLVIGCAPYGSPFMDAVIDWIEKKSTNLKSLHIEHMFVWGRYVDEGRDAGIKLAKTLPAVKNRIIIQKCNLNILFSNFPNCNCIYIYY